MNNFLPLPGTAKLYVVLLMWIERLEMISVVVIFIPSHRQR